jgi:hypothetical protein
MRAQSFPELIETRVRVFCFCIVFPGLPIMGRTLWNAAQSLVGFERYDHDEYDQLNVPWMFAERSRMMLMIGPFSQLGL